MTARLRCRTCGAVGVNRADLHDFPHRDGCRPPAGFDEAADEADVESAWLGAILEATEPGMTYSPESLYAAAEKFVGARYIDRCGREGRFTREDLGLPNCPNTIGSPAWVEAQLRGLRTEGE